jgi:diguanylate cyclase (GGDEF)-like protein/PAS domain S-box-containing protein
MTPSSWLPWRRRQGSGASTHPLWTIPCALLIAAATALAVLSFHDYADSRRRKQILLAEVERAASALLFTEEEAETPQRARSMDPPTARLLGALAALGHDPGEEAVDNIREAAGDYLHSLQEHLRLMRSGSAEAEEWQHRRALPSFGLVVEATETAETFYRAQASRALYRAKLASTVTIGAQTLFIALLVFATQRMKRLGELRLAEERVRKQVFFRSLVQNSSDVIALLDAAATIRYLSPAVGRVLGYEPEQHLERECFGIVHPEDREKAHLTFARALANADTVVVEQLRVRHGDGSWRWIELSATNLLADSNVGGIVVNFRDVSERMGLEDQLRHQALTDPLTGLANRILFQNLLERALTAGRRHDRQVAVFFLDLDDFKQINDGLGHDAGDQLLRQIADRLRANLRVEDAAARLGGDEFAVLLEDTDRETMREVAERMLAVMRRPFQLTEREVTVTMSIGVALTGNREYTAGELLRDADVALYAAKGLGKGRFEIFEDGMYKQVRQNLEIEMDLRRALEKEEFELHFQPIVELTDGRLIGVEALVRWRDSGQRRLVMPGEFLPVAEQTGLILPLGRWILERACAQMREWQLRFPDVEPVLLSVNLSARQFRNSGLIAEVEQALGSSGLASRQLVLEVPERVLLQDPEVTAVRLEGLRRLGVRVAVDDFGGGYFALTYLRRFPIDIVKIHNCFVAGAGQDAADSELTRSLIDLARRLKLQTIAEGVEAPRQAQALDDMGCELGQGYELGRPLAAAAFEKFFAAAEAGVCHVAPATQPATTEGALR